LEWECPANVIDEMGPVAASREVGGSDIVLAIPDDVDRSTD